MNVLLNNDAREEDMKVQRLLVILFVILLFHGLCFLFYCETHMLSSSRSLHFLSSYGSQLCDHLPHPNVLHPCLIVSNCIYSVLPFLCTSLSWSPVTVFHPLSLSYYWLFLPCLCLRPPPFLKSLSDLTVCMCTNPFMFMMDWDSSENWVFSLLLSPSVCLAWTAWTAQRWTWQTLNQCALALEAQSQQIHHHKKISLLCKKLKELHSCQDSLK